MFNHELFDNYNFEEVPLDRDIYVADEIVFAKYENSMLRFFEGAEYEHIGYVSYVATRAVNENYIELSWYANVHDRFHEIAITLPRDQFVACVGSWQCDEKARIFVKSEWLENIYLRTYSVFALIDAADIKQALANGAITRPRLVELRNRIDDLAREHTDVSFISFADSLLIKSNWSVGHFKSNVKYTYSPEVFVQLASEIDSIYQQVLGLNSYAVISQGSNEYYNDALLHISPSENHICLNSLGTPFAQLIEIEGAARKAVRDDVHSRYDLYMDEQYFHSLRFIYGFEKNTEPNNVYKAKMMSTPSKYYYSSFSNVLDNLDMEK
ncbi:MAG TPA: hypothetical protein ENI80_11985 [Acidiferrobacteraceae bacterium]|nr:hypothetical protein [Acidiferrobacteraceae bacterium]